MSKIKSFFKNPELFICNFLALGIYGFLSEINIMYISKVACFFILLYCTRRQDII